MSRRTANKIPMISLADKTNSSMRWNCNNNIIIIEIWLFHGNALRMSVCTRPSTCVCIYNIMRAFVSAVYKTIDNRSYVEWSESEAAWSRRGPLITFPSDDGAGMGERTQSHPITTLKNLGRGKLLLFHAHTDDYMSAAFVYPSHTSGWMVLFLRWRPPPRRTSVRISYSLRPRVASWFLAHREPHEESAWLRNHALGGGSRSHSRQWIGTSERKTRRNTAPHSPISCVQYDSVVQIVIIIMCTLGDCGYIINLQVLFYEHPASHEAIY